MMSFELKSIFFCSKGLRNANKTASVLSRINANSYGFSLSDVVRM